MDTADGGAGIDALPGDILVAVLRRLSTHSLARCRCVCALWRVLVDGRGLLLPHALPPRAFPGFFANARARSRRRRPGPGFLPPPASRGPPRDRLAFLRPHLPCAGAEAAVRHQCDGLVLCFVQDGHLAGVPGAGFVCNPVTERWARLPPPPTWWLRVRLKILRYTWWSSALYRQGSLYAHCEKRILVVLRCSEGTYDMVKLPGIADTDAGAGRGERYAEGHVLSSLPVDSIFPGTEDGLLVRYTSADMFRVRVWALHESVSDDGGGRLLEWTLTHDTDLAAHSRMLDLLHHAPSNCVPLAPEESPGRECVWFSDEDGEEAAGGSDVADGRAGLWNWDDASLLDMDIGADELVDVGAGTPSPSVLDPGVPPGQGGGLRRRRVAFHVVAYHLGSGKVQYLGRVMSLGDGDRLDGVFPYRPCIVDALPHDSW